MAKIKKEKLLLLISNFEKINIDIENGAAIDVNLLANCQNTAVELGNYIEVAYSNWDTSEMIHTLEGYCEFLYQLTLPENSDSKRKLVIKIKKLLFTLENIILDQMPADKKVVLFLPYKASMWDSLESLYFAARADITCETHVIPIPYFDKNSDGTFGMMHYEGDQFPSNIPITFWKDYCLNQNFSDEIYIHNPYDNLNYITSVHPAYYSSELKKYTNELIYVPYFILNEIEPDDQLSIEGMKHFIWTPGVINADKIIVQSEKMKQIYVNEFIKSAKACGLDGIYIDRKYQEERISGSGSPKIDKLLRTKKEDLDIPETWLKLVKKADGSWKKVILYNTSVNALLQNSEQMLDKIKDVFKLFYKYRNDIILLWRPHPLMLSTIKSMRPAFLKQYSEIVEKYRLEGWGIYDDTSDMDRAIIFSDAYYGDSSSLVQLYEITKKPIMIQDVNCNMERNDMEKGTLSCQNLWVDDEKIIIAVWDVDRVYEYQFSNSQSKIISGYIPLSKNKYALYGDIYRYKKNKYLFSPLSARKIAIYDSDQNLFHYIALKSCEEKVWLDKIICYNNKLYLIPANYDAIIQFDCETEQIEYIENCIYELKNKYGRPNKAIFRHGYALLGSDLFLASICYQGIILKINLDSYNYDIISLDNLGEFTSICGEGDACWLTTIEGNILEWNPYKNTYIKYLNNARGFTHGYAYFDIIKEQEYLIALPWNSNCITVFNLINKQITNINLSADKDGDKVCLCGKVYNGYLYTFSHMLKKLYVISIPDFKIIDSFKIYEAKNDKIEFWEGYIDGEHSNIYQERNNLSLREYIEFYNDKKS